MKFNTVDVDNAIEKLGYNFTKTELYELVQLRSKEHTKFT